MSPILSWISWVLFLLTAGLAQAATPAPSLINRAWTQVWEWPVPGEPRAVFSDATTGSVFVSYQQGTRARVSRIFSQSGVTELDEVASITGAAGPFRAYGGEIFWAVGNKVFSFRGDGGGRREVAALGDGVIITDLALDARGVLYLGTNEGVWKDGKNIFPQPVRGLFYLLDDLFVLVGGKDLHSFKKGLVKKGVCSKDCLGLERDSDGNWLSAGEKGVEKIGTSRGTKNSLVLSGRVSRFAYHYRKEPKEDLIILPLSLEKRVRAFQQFPAKK